MNDTGKNLEFPNLSTYAENCAQFPSDKLNQYAGMYVAWSPDGKRIVACGKDPVELWKALEEAGVHYSQVVGEYIPPPDRAILYTSLTQANYASRACHISRFPSIMTKASQRTIR